MAYAAALSLKQTIERLVSISESKNLLSESETTFIDDELDSFLETIESLHSIEIVDPASETRFKDAVQELEDLTDSRISDLLLSHQSESISSIDDETTFTLMFSQQLQKVKQELTSFLTTLTIEEDQQQRYCCSSSSSDYSNDNQQQNLLVGLDDQIKTLKQWIFDPTSIHSVKLVAGMTGIGKTTLVKQVYNDPRVVECFDTRLFVHIGPRYNRFADIQLLVLNQLGVIPSDKLLHKNCDYLDHQLSEALSTKKYLIVLDDVWTDILGLPDNGKGSRFIIISQIQSLVRSLPNTDVFLLPLLKDDQSWKLLRQKTFTTEEKCSRELEKIGKKIARNCEGLPAAIIQVGKNLRGKSFEEWKTLSENEDRLVVTRDDETPLSKALYFSYMMLPQYLKALFMYMGVFPKKYGISRSKLIKLWVSEGFLDPYWSIQYAENTAGRYLDVLISQSVVLREKETSRDIDTTKNCRLHFTFRTLCVDEAKTEKFFCVLKKYTDCAPKNIISQQRLCVHNNVVLAFEQVNEWMESVPNARSLLYYDPKQPCPVMLPLNF